VIAGRGVQAGLREHDSLEEESMRRASTGCLAFWLVIPAATGWVRDAFGNLHERCHLNDGNQSITPTEAFRIAREDDLDPRRRASLLPPNLPTGSPECGSRGVVKEAITLSIEINVPEHFDRASPLVTSIGTQPTLATQLSNG